MKRIFSYAIALMIAAVALANVLPKGIGSGQLPQPSRIAQMAEQAKKAQQKQTMQTPKPEVRNQAGRKVLPAKQPLQRTTTKQEGNLLVTTDEYGIVVNVTGGQNRYYTRQSSGTAYYPSTYDVITEPQSGEVITVWDGDVVYMYNILSRYDLASSWIKGKKEGDKVSFDSHQDIYYSDYFYENTNVCWAKKTTTSLTPLEDFKTISFTVDGDNLTLDTPENNDNYVIGAFWVSDRLPTGYCDKQTALVLDNAYTGPTYQMVDVPLGATIEEWYFNGTAIMEYSDPYPVKNAPIKVAIVGNDIYVQKYSLVQSELWIKGTINGDKVSFPKDQYLGKYYNYPYWFIGTNNGEEATELTDMTGTYDSAKKIITCSNGYLINASLEEVDPWERYSDVEISRDKKEYPEPIITELTASLPYRNTFETEEEQSQVAFYDANGDNCTFHIFDEGTNKCVRYEFHNYNAPDEYAVFPGFELKADKTYHVKVDAKHDGYNYEHFEIVAGEVAKASALNIKVLDSGEFDHKSYETYEIPEFSVEKDGTYYFAVHNITPRNGYYLFIDNFSVSENDPMAPDVVTDLKIVPNENGEKKATVSFVLPKKTIGGSTLSANLNVKVSCDDALAYTTTKAAGSTVSCEVEVANSAVHKFSVSTDYDNHYSAEIYVKEFVGEDYPSKVINTAGYDRNDKVELSWEPPKTGVNGLPVNPKTLTYNIYRVDVIEWGGSVIPVVNKEDPYVTGLAATTYTMDYETNVGKQDIKYFAISAVGELGEGETEFAYVLTGEAYDMPFHEEFPNGFNVYWWERNCDDDTYYETGGGWVTEYGDKFAFTCFGIPGGWISAETGKICLNGAKNPTVTIDYAGDVASKVSIIVTKPDGGTITKQFTSEITADFTRVTVPVAEYANEPWVRVKVLAEFDKQGIFSFTNVNVVDLYNVDLQATINAPESVKAGKDIDMTVAAWNLAEAANGDYTMQLYANGELYQEFEPAKLGFFEARSFDLTIPTSVFTVGKTTFKLVVDCDGDENPDNNVATAVVDVLGDDVCPVDAVGATEVDGGVLVDWSMEENVPVLYHEDFETTKMYDQKVADWTLVDADNCAIGTMGSLEIPFSKASWFSLDQSDEILSNYTTNNAYSGDKYMSTLYNKNGEKNDDWMISPELPGTEQTISFFAHTYGNFGMETIEVLYSTTDKELSSFVSLGKQDVPYDLDETVLPPIAKWFEYTFDLPEGAKYFALRCVSDNVYALFVDYVTFTRLRAIPTGYNVYVDGMLSGTAAADAREFLCRNHLTEGYHTFSVTALYGAAESSPLSIDIKTAGIDDITTDDNAPEAIYNLQGIRVSGRDLPAGFYIVGGQKVFKK